MLRESANTKITFKYVTTVNETHVSIELQLFIWHAVIDKLHNLFSTVPNKQCHQLIQKCSIIFETGMKWLILYDVCWQIESKGSDCDKIVLFYWRRMWWLSSASYPGYGFWKIFPFHNLLVGIRSCARGLHHSTLII